MSRSVGRLASELGEHEEVAVGSRTALLLAVELSLETKDCSDNVRDRVEGAEKVVVEEVALGGF